MEPETIAGSTIGGSSGACVALEALEHETIRLGGGIYTVPEVACILKIDVHKVAYWSRTYLQYRFRDTEAFQYHNVVDSHVVLNFYSLIETYSYFALKEAGVSQKEIVEAHLVLSDRYGTPYPFAHADLKQSGGEIITVEGLGKDKTHIRANKSLQTYLGFIGPFADKIHFGRNKLAEKYFPLGKEKAVVYDPRHQFGQATIPGTNILVSTIGKLKKAGESKDLIKNLYDLNDKQVDDAVHYFRRAA